MNQVIHTHEDRIYLFVGNVPEDADKFSLEINGKGISVLNYFVPKDVYSRHKEELLPPGNYTIIARASELSSNQVAELLEVVEVEDDWDEGEHYTIPYYKMQEPEEPPTSDEQTAFFSLLRSHGLKKETTIILFKQD